MITEVLERSVKSRQVRDCSECVKNRCKSARVHDPCINIGDDIPMKQA